MSRISIAFTRLVQIMETLRSPEGCPWDAEQTPESLKPYIIEETYEVLEAIDEGLPEQICEELGDLLLQVVFQSRIFEERGSFDIADVANAISDKLVRRHPHVFDKDSPSCQADLNAQWNRIKNEEKRAKGRKVISFGDIPRALPALQRTDKFFDEFNRVARVENATPSTAIQQIRQNLSELELALPSETPEAIEAHLGTVMLSLVELGRSIDLAPEETLQKTVTSLISHITSLQNDPDRRSAVESETFLRSLEGFFENYKTPAKKKGET